jgi:hypothetical protein
MKKRLFFEMPEDANPFPMVSVEFECPLCGKFEEVRTNRIPPTYLLVSEKGDKVERSSGISVLDVPVCKEHGCHMDPKKVVVFVLLLTESERPDRVNEINLTLAQYGGFFNSSLVVRPKVNRAGGDLLPWKKEDSLEFHQVQGACPSCLVRSLAVFDDPEASTKCEHCGAEMDCEQFISLNPRFVHNWVSLGALGAMVRGHFVSKGFHHGVFLPETGRTQDEHDVTRGMLEATAQAMKLAFDAEFPQFIMDSEEKLETLVKAVRSYLGLDEKDFAQNFRARTIARIVGSIWAGHPDGVKPESDPVWVFFNAKMPYTSTDTRVDDDIRTHNSKQPVVNDDLSVTRPGSPHVDLTEAVLGKEDSADA